MLKRMIELGSAQPCHALIPPLECKNLQTLPIDVYFLELAGVTRLQPDQACVVAILLIRVQTKAH